MGSTVKQLLLHATAGLSFAIGLATASQAQGPGEKPERKPPSSYLPVVSQDDFKTVLARMQADRPKLASEQLETRYEPLWNSINNS